jgi:hypothetical protein
MTVGARRRCWLHRSWSCSTLQNHALASTPVCFRRRAPVKALDLVGWPPAAWRLMAPQVAANGRNRNRGFETPFNGRAPSAEASPKIESDARVRHGGGRDR